MKYFFTVAILCIASFTFANQYKDIIPFEVIEGHIRVKLSINDSPPLDFVFDTGAAANLLSDKAAETLGLDLDGNMYVQGASGTSQMKLVKNTTFQFGQIPFSNQTFAVMDLSHLGDEDDPLDGVLGASVLNQYIVEIDYDQQEIRLYDNMEGIETSNYAEYKYSLAPFNIPIIESTLKLKNGKEVTGKYFVDTGAALAIMFNTNLVNEEHLIEEMGEHYTMESTSLSNSETTYISNAPEFVLFGHSFKDFSVRLSQANKGVNSFQGYHGIIGFDLLKRFNTIYDYANERMYVKPNQAFKEAFPKNYSGLQVKKSNDAYEVLNVTEKSAAAIAKIQIGDLILKVDGQKFDSKSALSDYFQFAKKDVIIAVMRNGEEFQLAMTPKPTIQ
jgi:hypothetical protein